MHSILRNLLFTSLLFGLSTANAEVVPVGIGIEPGTSCSEARATLYGSGTFDAESVQISALDSSVLQASGPLGVSSTSLNGSLARVIPFTKTATTGTLVGISYKLGTAGLDSPTTAEFFILYACTNGAVLYTCTGLHGECPETVEEYYPNMLLSDGYFNGDFGELQHRGEYAQTLGLESTGKLPLQIVDAQIDGRDAANFAVTYRTADPLPQATTGYIDISFFGNEPGAYKANLRISTNDLDQPIIDIPLTASVKNRPYLTIAIEELKQSDSGNSESIEGTVVISNSGFKTAAAGAKVVVIVKANSESDNSAPKKVAAFRLPKLRPGKTLRFPFTSKGHEFSEGQISKVINATLIGRASSVGSRSDRTATEYFYSDPGLAD